jgi:uncharacterized membrane protein YdjX (TVP38/TMEM64 family)
MDKTSETENAANENGSGKNKNRKQGLWRPIALIGLIILILIAAKVFGLGERMGALRDWIQAMGPMGPAVFILLYAVAVVAALPGSALTVAAGALFGSVLGVIVVSIASTLGASLSFLVGRYFARGAVAGWLSNKETFQKLDRLTEEQGAVIVAVTRLVPIFPFNLLNYGFGLTRVPFWTYVFWSWLCMLPGTVLFVVGADVVTKAIVQGEVPWLPVGALVVTAAVLALLVKRARKKLSGQDIETDADATADAEAES